MFPQNVTSICDAAGCPIHWDVTPGQAHENTSLIDLLNSIGDEMTTGDGEVVAWPVTSAGDKGSRAEWIDEMFLNMDIMPVIP